jgi:hypothetical protein
MTAVLQRRTPGARYGMSSGSSRDDLLQPVLGDTSSTSAAPYSVKTVFLTAFFGGPLAAVAILATNSYRLRRIYRDLPMLLLGVALFLISGWIIYRTSAGMVIRDWLTQTLGQRGIQYSFRLEALVIAAGGYLMHRQEQRTSDLLGLKRPNGWIGGLACLALGIVLQILVAVLLAAA